MSRRSRMVLGLVAAGVVAGLLVVVGVAAATHWHPGDDTANGTGLTYDGRFYWASGGRVQDAALADPVASAVPFQDTTADLRRIVGLDPEVTLAALLPSLDGSPGGLRWTLVSTDQGRGTNPAAYPDTAAVLDTAT